ADSEAMTKADRQKNTLVYEYIDHIDPKISGHDENIRILQEQRNRAFSGEVDYIVASAEALYDEAVEAIGRDKVVLVPNGVDTNHYRNHRRDVAIPASFKEFRRKYSNVVGYFGALAPWIWYDEI